MKWKETDFNGGIDKIRAVLIYGPDAGQVDELCDRATEKLEIEKDNLFVLIEYMKSIKTQHFQPRCMGEISDEEEMR